jgi:hypothetical protein
MACAWLLSFPGLPTRADCEDWAQAVAVSSFRAAVSEATSEWERCLNILLTSQIEVSKDKPKMTIGDVLAQMLKPENPERAYEPVLKTFGLARVMHRSKVEEREQERAGGPKPEPRLWLAMVYEHEGLEQIFRNSSFRNGGWRGVLSRMPEAEKNHPATFAGLKRSKAVLLPASIVQEQQGDAEYGEYQDPPAAARAAEQAMDLKTEKP